MNNDTLKWLGAVVVLVLWTFAVFAFRPNKEGDFTEECVSTGGKLVQESFTKVGVIKGYKFIIAEEVV